MPRERVLPFVKARRGLSEIIDQVSAGGRPVIIAKRQRPVAAIIGLKEYREMAGGRKYLREVKGKQILKIRGIATAVGDIDKAVNDLRRSRIATLTQSI